MSWLVFGWARCTAGKVQVCQAYCPELCGTLCVVGALYGVGMCVCLSAT